MERMFQEEIMAIVPEYIENNCNHTVIHKKNGGSMVLDKSIKTVLRSLGKYYMIDLEAMKKKYSPLISSRNLVPIPLSKEDVLIPIKTRIEPYKNDGAFSYINMKYIKKIKKHDKLTTIILLENDIEIKCFSSIDTVNKHLRNGKIISKCYEERLMGVKEEETNYNHFIPATKADLEEINKKLEAIMKMGNIKF